MLVLITLATFVSTLLGGLFALRLRDRLHLILGFSAGAIIGVAFFDLMPESLSLGGEYHSAGFITGVIAAGFLMYMVLDRVVILHGHGHDHDRGPVSHRGSFGAGSLSLHSFLDGVGIGLAFKVSPELGLIVAIAVLTHDFSDGINTVGLIVKNGGERSRAVRWLLVDACAPALGVLSTLFFTISEATLAIFLAVFSGFFLYIGASDLLPESHHAHPKLLTTCMTLLGALVLYGAVMLAGL